MGRTGNASAASGWQRARRRVGRLLADAVDLLFGFDFFISYAHGDGMRYPQELADRLAQLGFRVFLDARLYVPGDDLQTATRRRVRMSRKLVLIARPLALSSQWVLKEVEECLAAGRTPVVIDINRTIEDAGQAERLQALLRDKLHIRETVPTLDAAPGEQTITQLVRSFKATRQDRLRLRAVLAATLALAGFAVLAGWQAHVADRARVEAERQRGIAVARQLAAQAEAGLGAAPDSFERSLMLAVEATRRLAGADQAAADSAPTLRRALALGTRPLAAIAHAAAVGPLAVSADGAVVASGDDDGKVLLWNALTGARIAEFAHGDEEVLAIAFDAAEARFATLARDRLTSRVFTTRLWATDAAHPRWMRCSFDHVDSLAFAADALLLNTQGVLALGAGGGHGILAVAATDGAALPALRAELAAIGGEGRQVLSPDGQRIAAADAQGIGAIVVGGTTAEQAQRLAGGVDALWFVDRGAHLVSHERGLLRVRDARSLAEIGRIPLGERPLAVAFSGRAELLATVVGRVVRVWDLPSGRELRRLAHPGIVRAVEFAAAGARIVTTAGEAAYLWKAPRRDAADGIEAVVAPFIDSAGGRIATVDADGRTLSIRDARSGAPVNALGHQARVTAFAFDARGARIAVLAGQQLHLWTLGETPRRTTVALGEPAAVVRFSATGDFVAVLGDARLHLVAAGDGAMRAQLPYAQTPSAPASGGPTAPHKVLGLRRPDADSALRVQLTLGDDGDYALLFAAPLGFQAWNLRRRAPVFETVGRSRLLPDGRHLLTVTATGVAVRDLASGEERPLGPPVTPDGVIDASGRYILLRDGDGISLWDAVSATRVGGTATVTRSRAVVGAVAPTGTHFALGAGRRLDVFDRATGSAVASLALTGWTVALAFDGDGRHLAVADIDSETGLLTVRVLSHDRAGGAWPAIWQADVAGYARPDLLPAAELAFTADNTRLTLLRHDGGPTQDWLWAPEALAALACLRSGANLGLADWRRALGAEPYRAVCTDNPLRAEDLLILAQEALAQGDRDAARARFAEASAAGRAAPSVDLEATLCIEAGRARLLDAVLPSCHALLALRPQDLTMRLLVALLQAYNGRTADAAQGLRAAVGRAGGAASDEVARALPGWADAFAAGRDPFADHPGGIEGVIERLAAAPLPEPAKAECLAAEQPAGG